ncbi:MAG: hypothetical protein GY822_21490 [Deltaproteobacteria bacterium]|nr:hypothetical protein [Deltaproteobacteria bacterium]
MNLFTTPAFGKRCSPQWIAMAAFASLSTSFACGVEADSALTPVSMSLPQALLTNCAFPPADLAAELWVSGVNESCALDVDVTGGSVSGVCTIPAGRDRTLTLDYFVVREGIRVLLAQVRERIALANAEAEMTWDISKDDVNPLECLDITDDQLNGSDIQVIGGSARPVCDLDDSCQGTPATDCSNLGEICAGENPLS